MADYSRDNQSPYETKVRNYQLGQSSRAPKPSSRASSSSYRQQNHLAHDTRNRAAQPRNDRPTYSQHDKPSYAQQYRGVSRVKEHDDYVAQYNERNERTAASRINVGRPTPSYSRSKISAPSDNTARSDSSYRSARPDRTDRSGIPGAKDKSGALGRDGRLPRKTSSKDGVSANRKKRSTSNKDLYVKSSTQPRKHSKKQSSSSRKAKSNTKSTTYEKMYGYEAASAIPEALHKLGFRAIVAAIIIIAFMALFHLGPFGQTEVKNDGDGVFGQSTTGTIGDRLKASVISISAFSKPVESKLSEVETYDVGVSDIKSLSGQAEPYVFNLASSKSDNTEKTRDISEYSKNLINEATSYYAEKKYPFGYFFLDLESGRGIASNLDAQIYGASSIKGPFCAYIAQTQFPSSIDKANSNRKKQIEKTILYSDNKSYMDLRKIYAGQGFDEWLTSAGIRTGLINDTFYPTYSTRESALLWLKTYEYIKGTDSDTSKWFTKLLSTTDVSFIRNGVMGTKAIAGASDATQEAKDASRKSTASTTTSAQVAVPDTSLSDSNTANSLSLPLSLDKNTKVLNKAGWIAGDDLNCICDAGIVTINGRDYLMSIMAGARDVMASETACANLANVLVQIRGELL